MLIAFLVAFWLVFTAAHVGLQQRRRYHAGAWVADELLELAGVDPYVRGWPRDEPLQAFWLATPTVRRVCAGIPTLTRQQVNGRDLVVADPYADRRRQPAGAP